MSFYPSTMGASGSTFLLDGIACKKDLNIQFFVEDENRHENIATTLIKAVNYRSQVYAISQGSNRVYKFDGAQFLEDSSMYIPQSPTNCSIFATDDMLVYTTTNDDNTTSFFYQGEVTDYKWVKGPDIPYRFCGAVAFFKDRFHIFGGSSLDDTDNSTTYGKFEIGDAEWTILNDTLPFSFWHSIAIVHDVMYFLGTGEMWGFDGASFRPFAEPPFELSKCVSIINVYDKFLCIGTDGTLNVFDIRTGIWHQVSGFSRKIDSSYSGRLFKYNNGIFCLGLSSDLYKVCRFGYKEV